MATDKKQKKKEKFFSYTEVIRADNRTAVINIFLIIAYTPRILLQFFRGRDANSTGRPSVRVYAVSKTTAIYTDENDRKKEKKKEKRPRKRRRRRLKKTRLIKIAEYYSMFFPRRPIIVPGEQYMYTGRSCSLNEPGDRPRKFRFLLDFVTRIGQFQNISLAQRTAIDFRFSSSDRPFQTQKRSCSFRFFFFFGRASNNNTGCRSKAKSRYYSNKSTVYEV